MKIVAVSKTVADEFVAKKHYSRRPSMFWCAFGLVENGFIQGVVVYGQPSPPIQRHAFSDRDFRLYELCRLVIQTDTKNAASFLVAGSLRMLPKPCAVISYADSEWGHCGIVYQATNWLYTGATVSHDHLYLVAGERLHPMTLRYRGVTNPKKWASENNIRTVRPKPKHRYFFICGSNKEKKKMRGALKYAVSPEYPKSGKTRYDDGPSLLIPAVHMELFT